jgi:hypothetical protein
MAALAANASSSSSSSSSSSESKTSGSGGIGGGGGGGGGSGSSSSSGGHSISAGSAAHDAASCTAQQVTHCQFHLWYDALRKHTLRSVCVPLPAPFVAYLRQDGLVLPVEAQLVLAPATADSDDEDDDGGDDQDQKQDDDDDDDDDVPPPSFPKVVQAIEAGMKALGGSSGVFPRLNWSGPTDATWIMPERTCRCTSAADVILMLKASNKVSRDLQAPYARCSANRYQLREAKQYTLVLRRWANLNPAQHFRCFVYRNELAGICQRHPQTFEHLQADASDLRLQVKDAIFRFYFYKLQGKFVDDKFVFDVYVDRNFRVWLLSIKPFGGAVTDPVLLTYAGVIATSEAIIKLEAAADAAAAAAAAADVAESDADTAMAVELDSARPGATSDGKFIASAAKHWPHHWNSFDIEHVSSANAHHDAQRSAVVSSVMSRLPAEAIDVSSAASIDAAFAMAKLQAAAEQKVREQEQQQKQPEK